MSNTRYFLVVTAFLALPSTAELLAPLDARDGDVVGTCYQNAGCPSGDVLLSNVTYGTCVGYSGGSWSDPSGNCENL